MRKSLLILTLLIASSAHAALYQCEKDGKKIYQETPCDPQSVSKAIETENPAYRTAWGDLKYGMSVDDVIRASPGGARRVSTFHLEDGAKELLRREAVKVAGINFNASYYFIDNKFVQVNLKASPEAVKNEVTVQHYERLLDAFRRRYGDEHDRMLRNDKWGAAAEVNWLIDGNQIQIVILTVTPETSTLSFAFHPAKPKEQED